MLYLFPNGNNECSIHYQPALLTEEEKAKGIAVDSLPTPQTPAGKQAILKANKVTGEVWYDYVDSQQTPLEQRVDLLENALNELALGGI